MVYIISDPSKGNSQHKYTKRHQNWVSRDKADVNAAASTDQQQIDSHNVPDSPDIVRNYCKVDHRNAVCECNYRIVEEKITWEVLCIVADQVATEICSARNQNYSYQIVP